jgi:hypothetical protein
MRAVAAAGLSALLAHATPPSEPFFFADTAMKGGGEKIDMFLEQTAYTSSLSRTHDSHMHVNGHFLKVKNPKGRFSVVPPLPGGCGTVQHVKETAHLYQPECLVAVDAGYYELHKPVLFDCIGNVVSAGEVHNTAQLNESNVNFGVMKNGSFVIGYISPEMVNEGQFEHLVAGLGWLVRDGKNYVKEGWKEAYTKAGASGDEYVSMTSGRTAVGYTADGELVILQYDGHTHAPSWGATLMELADKLIEFNVTQAINLDGGGSTQMWKRDPSTTGANAFQQIGYSSDRGAWGILDGTYEEGCPIGNSADNLSKFQCARMVTTILCVHEATTGDEEVFHKPVRARLAANATKGESKIQVSDASIFAPGDSVVVAKQKSWEGSETQVVASIGENNTIQLEQPLADSYEMYCTVTKVIEQNAYLMSDDDGFSLGGAGQSSNSPFSAWSMCFLIVGLLGGAAIGVACARGTSERKSRSLVRDEEDQDSGTE